MDFVPFSLVTKDEKKTNAGEENYVTNSPTLVFVTNRRNSKCDKYPFSSSKVFCDQRELCMETEFLLNAFLQQTDDDD